jgi:ribosomal protein S18 acetylase RimI-like enzyme
MHRLYRSAIPGPPQEFLYAHLVRHFPQLSAVAVAPEGLVGYALGRVQPGFLEPRPAAFLYSIAVAPSHRGRGAGRALFEFFCDGARLLGLREVDLEVERDNAPARSLYAAFGLTETEMPRTGKDRTVHMVGRLGSG